MVHLKIYRQKRKKKEKQKNNKIYILFKYLCTYVCMYAVFSFSILIISVGIIYYDGNAFVQSDEIYFQILIKIYREDTDIGIDFY